MSVCPTTNVCHESSITESCDSTNETCLIGQTLVQRADESRYCTNSSLLPSIGQTCTELGLVYCEALNECQNVSASLLCRPCPVGLFYCDISDSCIENMTDCCVDSSYYCDLLGMCIDASLRCELPNVAPEVVSQLIHLESVTVLDIDLGYPNEGHVIAELLGNSTHPGVDSQGEQVSIAIVQVSPVVYNDGEWQYSLCDNISTCSEWMYVDGDVLSELNALVLPNNARVRFVIKSIELAGAVWLRVRIWDGNEDGYVSPRNDLVSLSSPQYLPTLPYSDRGAFSENTAVLTLLVHPYIRPPVFNSQASFKLTSILEDTVFAYNLGNVISDVVESVEVQYLNPLPEGIVHGFSSLPNGAEIELLLPFDVRESYLGDVRQANSVRLQRRAARDSGQLPGVAIALNLLVPSSSGKWQVSLSGDPKRFVSIASLIDPSTQLLLLNTTARLRFLPEVNFCGDVSILLGAWDGFWNPSVAIQLDSGYVISYLPPARSILSDYNLNEFEEVLLNVSCMPDKPVVQVQQVLLDPIPYRISYRYERLFTALLDRDSDSVRGERSTLESYLQLILRVPATIRRISKALNDRYVYS